MSGITANPPKDFAIVPAGAEHVAGMAKCHVDSFAGEFMTLVGVRFIRGFYRFYIAEKAITFVALGPSGQVVGLVCGGEPSLRQRFIRRYGPLYAPDIISSALRSNYARKRLLHHLKCVATAAFRGLQQVGHKKPQRSAGHAEPSSSLLSVCTVPDARGKGVGAALMEHFENESRARRYKAVQLSVHADNTAAIRLYNKCGWEIVSKSKTSIVFKKDLQP